MLNLSEEANKRFPGKRNKVFRNYYIVQSLGATSRLKTEEPFVHTNQVCFNSVCFGPHELDGRNYLTKEDITRYLNRIFDGSDIKVAERALNYLMELVYKNTEFRDCISVFLAQRQLSFKGQICDTDGSCEYVTLGKLQQSSSLSFPGASAAELPDYFSDISGTRLMIENSTNSFGTLQQYENNAISSICTVALAAVGAHLFFKAAKGISSLVKSALGYDHAKVEEETDSSKGYKV